MSHAEVRVPQRVLLSRTQQEDGLRGSPPPPGTSPVVPHRRPLQPHSQEAVRCVRPTPPTYPADGARPAPPPRPPPPFSSPASAPPPRHTPPPPRRTR